MSACKYCGDRITWVKRPDGNSYYPPFEVTDRTEFDEYFLTWHMGGWVATPVHSDDDWEPLKLIRHKCEQYEQKSVTIPKDWDNHEVHLAKHSEVLAQSRAVARCNEKHYTLEQLLALSVKLSVLCPQCWAAPFKWCVYVADRETNTKQLHTLRGK